MPTQKTAVLGDPTRPLVLLFLALPFLLGTCWATLARQGQEPPSSRSAPSSQPQSGQRTKPEELPAVLPKGKRLILKDGTFHQVRSYERLLDPSDPSSPGRVRFYSVERSAWEEIPADLVDWEATRKAELEDVQRRQMSLEKLKAATAAERVANIEVDSSIEITPGVFLPDAEGLYVVQGRAVIPLAQATAYLKLDKGRVLAQLLSPVPIVPTRHKIQIAGKRATLRLTPPSGETLAHPEFYIRVSIPEEGRTSRSVDEEPNLELIRAQVKGDSRLLELLNTYVTGETETKRQSIIVERWKVARRVYRLTVQQGLEPGEYVLAEILPEGMNLYVWDFGVDPALGASTKKPWLRVTFSHFPGELQRPLQCPRGAQRSIRRSERVFPARTYRTA